MPTKPITIALAGNPNSGKTTIFNAMTGAHQHVGNWPGVTVEKKEGRFKRHGREFVVVDLPGTYSLSPYSLEEVVARNYLLAEKPDVVVQVIDSSNLERNLFLTTQLMELGRPLVLALNIYDALQRSGARLDTAKLGERFGASVVPTIGVRGKGVSDLVKACIAILEKDGRPASTNVLYGEDVEPHINRIMEAAHLPEAVDGVFPPRWTAVKLLENDRDAEARLTSLIDGAAAPIITAAANERALMAFQFQEDAESTITARRYRFIAETLNGTFEQPPAPKVSVSDRLDRILTHKIFGLPVFFLMIWLIFQATFRLGRVPVDAISGGVAWLSNHMSMWIGAGFFRDLVVDGAIDGVGSVLVFLPNIFILFFCISLIEDSGYMARAAFLMDRVMRSVGLHGKAFIPLLMGFGCNVPAVMATRTLDTHRDRLLTMLVNPLVSCSARLPVYILLAGTFFAPGAAGTVIFSLYTLGIVLAVLMAKLFSKTILKGKASPFMMELPPYRMPTMKNSLLHMWDRGKMFLRKMGGIILVGSLSIWVLTYFPREVPSSKNYDHLIAEMNSRIDNLGPVVHGSATAREEDYLTGQVERLNQAKAKDKVENSYLGRIGRAISPVFKPLGFNWESCIAIVSGFVAKEIVVSTFGVIYETGENHDASSMSLRDNLRRSGMSKVRAYALMAFVLIYTPCLGTLAAIRRETNSWKWTAFSAGYSLILAWVVAFLITQGGTLLGLS